MLPHLNCPCLISNEPTLLCVPHSWHILIYTTCIDPCFCVLFVHSAQSHVSPQKLRATDFWSAPLRSSLREMITIGTILMLLSSFLRPSERLEPDLRVSCCLTSCTNLIALSGPAVEASHLWTDLERKTKLRRVFRLPATQIIIPRGWLSLALVPRFCEIYPYCIPPYGHCWQSIILLYYNALNSRRPSLLCF